MANLNQRPAAQPQNSQPQPDRRSVEFWLDLDHTGALAYQAARQGWSIPADDGDED